MRLEGMTMRNEWIGEWQMDVEYRDGRWLASVRFDTGYMAEEGATREEAIDNLRMRWIATGITGKFAPWY